MRASPAKLVWSDGDSRSLAGSRDVVVLLPLYLYCGVSPILPLLRVATGMRLPRARSHVLVLMSRRKTPNYRLLD